MTQVTTTQPAPSTHLPGAGRFTYQLPWDGKTRFPSSPSRPLAFDTETEVVDQGVPRIALASVSCVTRSAVLHPSQLPAFLLVHRGAHVVGHNFAFDFWVVDKYLRTSTDTNASAALAAWWGLVDTNHVHDTMVLDMLIRIARGDGAKGGAEDGIWARDLGEVASSYAGVTVDKADPYRLRYVEIIGKKFEDVERGFFDYAVKDSVATVLTYQGLHNAAWRVRREYAADPDVLHDAEQNYGVLTQSLQVKAAIALARIEHTGLCVDADKVERLDALYRAQVDDVIEFMRCRWPDLFKYKKPPKPPKVKQEKVKLPRRKKGDPPHPRPVKPPPPPPPPREALELVVTPKSRLPALNKKELVSILEGVAEELDVDVPKSTGKKKETSTSVKVWAEHADSHVFLQAWPLVAESSKLLGFLSIAARDTVLRPRYGLLKLTGRTSSFSPNLQQWPRLQAFRELFVPRLGHRMLTIDYSAIELCTLAAVCYRRYGFSRLGDTIRERVDPHAYTAAMILGAPLEDFMRLKTGTEAEQKFYKSKRQSGKVCNFGVPGGLGPRKLVLYAKAQYGVEMSEEEAAIFRYKLTREIYPELSDRDGYLADSCWRNLAHNLRVSERVLKGAFDVDGDPERAFIVGRCVGKVLRGAPVKHDGTPYKAEFLERMWGSIASVFELSPAVRPEDLEEVRERKGSPKLFYRYCAGTVATLTGRFRGSVDYTAERNCPFQGLAADGGKLALWNLLKEDFRVVGFIHDEVLVELPEDKAEELALRVQQIMQDSMSQVLGGAVPVSTEYHLADHWCK